MILFKTFKITKDIFHLQFKSKYLMNSTLLRFTEIIESPKFRSKIGFTLEEFMDWYSAEYGCFDYFEKWYGHNIGSELLLPFYRGQMNPLSQKEKIFLKRFEKILHKKFYIVATFKQDKTERSTLKHEVSHALYEIDKIYHKKINESLDFLSKDNQKKTNKELKRMGYSEDVFLDETHAYLLENYKDFFRFEDENVDFVSKKIKKIYKEHTKCFKNLK